MTTMAVTTKSKTLAGTVKGLEEQHAESRKGKDTAREELVKDGVS